jgi:hypothetical protein
MKQVAYWANYALGRWLATSYRRSRDGRMHFARFGRLRVQWYRAGAKRRAKPCADVGARALGKAAGEAGEARRGNPCAGAARAADKARRAASAWLARGWHRIEHPKAVSVPPCFAPLHR